jgi:predicted phage terminase large subunit-like protein
VCHNTRWHEDDFIGRLIKASADGSGIPFRAISLPALAEDDDPLGRVKGEGLWLEKFPQAWYEQRRAGVSAYTWSALYQQRPSPPGGNMVDPAWWRFYRPTEIPDKFDQVIQYWDLALDSVKKTDSYMCGLVLARKAALVYVLAAFHEHCDINKVISAILEFQQLFPKAKQKLVERAISGNAIVQMLHHRVSGLVAWPPKGRRKGSKEACLNAVVPDIRSGNILLPLGADGQRPRWVQELIEELRQFPRAPNDDFVDCVSGGVDFLLPSARRAMDEAQSEAIALGPQAVPAQAHVAALHATVRELAREHMQRTVAPADSAGVGGLRTSAPSVLTFARPRAGRAW